MGEHSKQLSTKDYMRDYFGFWRLAVRNAWPPFRGTISAISWVSVLLVIVGIAGFFEDIQVQLRDLNNPIANWYVDNSWVFLVAVFLAWIFFWGTYKAYLGEKQRADDCQTELQKMKSKDEERKREIEELELEEKKLAKQNRDRITLI